MLKKLWNSSTDLLKRFNLAPTPQVSFRKFQEECDEFEAAIFDKESDEFEATIFDPDDTGEPLLEAVDVMVTILNMLYALGYTYENLESAVERVIVKNDSKSWKSHHIVNGTIERIGRKR